jgi:hypothetical protein
MGCIKSLNETHHIIMKKMAVFYEKHNGYPPRLFTYACLAAGTVLSSLMVGC